MVIVRKLPAKLPQVKVLPELVERKSPYLKFPPITATSGEFVDVPKTPNTNPATATEPTRVTATISTVATKGEMALFPRTHPAAKAAHRGFLRRIHDPGRPNNASQTRVRVTRPQVSLSLGLPCFHHPSCAFSGPNASLISPCLQILIVTSSLRFANSQSISWAFFTLARLPSLSEHHFMPRCPPGKNAVLTFRTGLVS